MSHRIKIQSMRFGHRAKCRCGWHSDWHDRWGYAGEAGRAHMRTTLLTALAGVPRDR